MLKYPRMFTMMFKKAFYFSLLCTAHAFAQAVLCPSVVERGLGKPSCFQIGGKNHLIYCSPTKETEFVEIDRFGNTLREIKETTEVYDGSQGLCNEFTDFSSSRPPDTIRVQGFKVDPQKIQHDPQGKIVHHYPNSNVPYLSLDGIFLIRNYETHSMDGPEGRGHAEFASFSLFIISNEKLDQILIRELNISSDKLFENKFQFSKHKDQHHLRKKVSYVLKTNYEIKHERVKVDIPGAYLNDKKKASIFNARFWHGVANQLDGKEPRQCEWCPDSEEGSQVISYDPSVFELISLPILQSKSKDSDFIVVYLVDGDGSLGVSEKKKEAKDDLMGIFKLKVDDLVKGRSFLYRQQNSEGGIDWALVLSVR